MALDPRGQSVPELPGVCTCVTTSAGTCVDGCSLHGLITSEAPPCEYCEAKDASRATLARACTCGRLVSGEASLDVDGFVEGAVRASQRYELASWLRQNLPRLRSEAAQPVVWADDATPFDGAQAKALLIENECLRAALALTATHLGIGFEPAADDLDALMLVPEQTDNVLQALRRAATGAPRSAEASIRCAHCGAEDQPLGKFGELTKCRDINSCIKRFTEREGERLRRESDQKTSEGRRAPVLTNDEGIGGAQPVRQVDAADDPLTPPRRPGASEEAGTTPEAVPNACLTGEPADSDRVHYLKCWPPFFDAVVSGAKRFEFRENDRDYQVGDVLALADWDPQTAKYSGRHANVRVTYLFAGGTFGLSPKFCVMSIEALPKAAPSSCPAAPYLGIRQSEDRAGPFWQVTGPLRSTLDEAKADLEALVAGNSAQFTRPAREKKT